MVAILDKIEHNVDFHPIVDFVEATPLRIETTEEGTKILATIDGNLRTVSESSIRRNLKLNDEAGISSLPDAELFENLTLMGYNISPNQKFTFQKGQFSHQCTPTEPHHTPSPEAQQTSPTSHSSPTLPHVTTANIPPVIPTAPLPTVVPTDTPPLRHYTRKARIAQSSALPPVADEPASLLKDDSQGKACPTDYGFEADQDRANIAKTSTLPHELTSRVTSLAADEGSMQHKLNELMALCISLQSCWRIKIEGLKNTLEMMPQSRGGATVLASRVVEVPTGSGSIPTDGPPATKVPTGSDVVSTAGLIFATTSVVTPYTRRKGKETMVESETSKKKKVQEQIDAQVARELEEKMAREDQRMSEHVARDAEIARIHVEEELQIMIDGLDRNNETVAKYLQEYHQFATELPIEIRIELISDLVRYQDNYAKAGWKAKHFKGMTLEEIKENFDPVWKQIHDFIPIGSKEKAERF
nr:hypothetical protein [Tanacetum cinerariifolium]